MARPHLHMIGLHLTPCDQLFSIHAIALHSCQRIANLVGLVILKRIRRSLNLWGYRFRLRHVLDHPPATAPAAAAPTPLRHHPPPCWPHAIRRPRRQSVAPWTTAPASDRPRAA